MKRYKKFGYSFIQESSRSHNLKTETAVLRIDYCPKCFNELSFEVDSKNKIIVPHCNYCDWRGNWDNCLDDGEAKNFKRIKIIDNILNE